MSASGTSNRRARRTGRRRERVRGRLLALITLLAVCLVALARLGKHNGPRWYWHENSDRPAGGLAAL